MDSNVIEYPRDEYHTSEKFRAKRNGSTGLTYPSYLQLKEPKPESKFRVVRFFNKIYYFLDRWLDKFSGNLLP